MWKLERIKREQSRRSIDRTEIGQMQQGLEEEQIKSLRRSLSKDHPLQLYTYCATPFQQEGEIDVEFVNQASDQVTKVNDNNQKLNVQLNKEIKLAGEVEKQLDIKEQSSTASVSLLNSDNMYRPSDTVPSSLDIVDDRVGLLQSQQSSSTNGDEEKHVVKDEQKHSNFESFRIESAHTGSTPIRSAFQSRSKLFNTKCLRRIPFSALLQLSVLWVLFLVCSILKTLDGRSNSNLIYEVELVDFSPVEEGKAVHDMFFEERLEAAQRRRLEGNELYREGAIDSAINKYIMGFSYIDEELMMQLQGFHLDRAEDVLGLIHLNLATAYLQKHEYEQVIHHASQVLMNDDKNAKAYYRRGKAKLNMGQTEAAKKDLTQAQHLAPNDKHILGALKELKQIEGEERQAQAKLFKGRLPPQKQSTSEIQANQWGVWSILMMVFTRIMKMLGLKS
eukprot:TRINITY_DN8242_c1_g1_i1.p1 TRINITY_DN8242_c1_g1~~TRINITY_DN8242_c1_g1_i1.p1  ORF type:complete len:524 (-),score=60.09 TRINITY_DN8242_c1_g1_i1:297-1640(-)